MTATLKGAALTEQRVEFIDITKGFGMLLVAWGHIMLGGWTNIFIYSFHMPLFFILSGMLFDRSRYSSFQEFFVKRVKRLFIPYVVYSTITWCVWVAYSIALNQKPDNLWMPLLQTFIAQGSGGFLVHNVPLWFVTCMFLTEIAYYWIDRLPEKINALVCSLSIIFGYVLIEKLDITLLPWSIEVVFVAILFYAVGNIFCKHVNLSDFQKWVEGKKGMAICAICVLGLVTFAGSQITGHISLGSDCLGNNIALLLVDAIAGSLITILLCILLGGVSSRHLING